MTHCVRLLLKYPETYKRLADDIRHQFKSPEEVAYDKVRQSLPYLQAVIYETMRMRAATNGVWPRDAPPEGIVLHGYYIPHGVTLCGSIGGVHMNPETWDEPTRFDPERFMGPEGEARKRLVVAFSTGARICPGRHLAMMSMMLTLTHLLLRYDFAALSQPDMHVSYYDEVDDQCRITTGHSRPERDCNVIIAKRF
ncbi:hypothetical protein FBU59_003593 [Linderina macrospora]|uniref:Uncharacterized protein n=1 Tax=Linderina macrospora TaxID=4868 RepID=A0ACC1J7X2_9FUNG|nr:hypothetical protein FBU59_003593 [Linderina macrospora]